MQDLIDKVTNAQINHNLADFRQGDTVKVYVSIKEGTRERVQIFEGTVIKIKGSGISKTFTVRKVSSNIGVEKVFPFHSPKISNIEILRRSKVRRAKLYYLRKLKGKSARLKEKKKAVI